MYGQTEGIIERQLGRAVRRKGRPYLRDGWCNIIEGELIGPLVFRELSVFDVGINSIYGRFSLGEVSIKMVLRNPLFLASFLKKKQTFNALKIASQC